MSRTLLLVAALSSIGAIRAQQSPLSGPVEGYTFDAPTGSIRAVIGFLGSASFGPAVLEPLDFASVAPDQDYAIAVRRGECVFVSGLGSSTLSISTLAEFSSPPEGVAWSDDGTIAVVYSKTENWIQTFAGLPASISAGTPLSISPLGGSLSAVAADADGQTVAIGITGNNAGVYEIAGSQSFTPLLSVSSPIALAFSGDGSALYALDAATNQVSEINLATSATQTWPPGVEDAVAIRPARDAANRKVLYVAGGSSRLLLALDDSSHQTVASVPLSFDPMIIEPLGTNGFVLRPRMTSSDPLWSFTNGAQPMVYFVPAMPSQATRREVRH